MKLQKPLFILLSFLFLASSCVSHTKVRSFVLGDGKMLYFVDPFTMTNTDSHLKLDLTIQENMKVMGEPQKITLNFSLFDSTMTPHPSALQQAYFLNAASQEKASLTEISVLFVDRIKGEMRYTSIFQQEAFLNWVHGSSDEFIVVYENKTYAFVPGEDYEKQKSTLKIQFPR